MTLPSNNTCHLRRWKLLGGCNTSCGLKSIPIKSLQICTHDSDRTSQVSSNIRSSYPRTRPHSSKITIIIIEMRRLSTRSEHAWSWILHRNLVPLIPICRWLIPPLIVPVLSRQSTEGSTWPETRRPSTICAVIWRVFGIGWWGIRATIVSREPSSTASRSRTWLTSARKPPVVSAKAWLQDIVGDEQQKPDPDTIEYDISPIVSFGRKWECVVPSVRAACRSLTFERWEIRTCSFIPKSARDFNEFVLQSTRTWGVIRTNIKKQNMNITDLWGRMDHQTLTNLHTRLPPSQT